ncbi:TPA: hypothetical protein N0F65_001201 [Lagenidium giganteum]|uniref:Uncharacterized protein n=1 Tax=Lagenidium giganteum TaxID=4803 RepID=A0AAV2Z4V8_9STRA|nr:TPA: hypothetical protein N0F65_001201 [Lagenidium giganteum]
MSSSEEEWERRQSLRRRNSMAVGTTTSLVLQTFQNAATKRQHASVSPARNGHRVAIAPEGHDIMQMIINSSPGCYANDDGSSDIFDRYNFYAHGKRFLFSPCSLGIFNEASQFRQWMIWCITSKVFDQFILLLIAANSIILALADYSKVTATGDLDDTSSFRNLVVNYADSIFTTLFSVECTMKIIAMGLFGDQGAYLMDPWNWLDFIVVFIGILAVIPGIPNVSVLRTFRVLRPLRSLNAIAGMKKLVTALLRSIPGLLTVVVFLMFLFFLYGLIGVQLWSGVGHPRCRLTPVPVKLSPYLNLGNFSVYEDLVVGNFSGYICKDHGGEEIPLNDDNWTHDTSPWKIPRVCFWPVAQEEKAQTCAINSTLYRQCPLGQTCGSDYDNYGNFRFTHPNKDVLMYRLQTTTFNDDMMWGFINFDNIGSASIAIFQCITTSGWSDIMYMLQDAGFGFVSVVYFVSFIVMGSFFMINLMLAVIWENFSEASLIEAEERSAELMRLERATSMLSRTRTEAEAPAPKRRLIKLPTSAFRLFIARVINHWAFNSMRTCLILLNTIILSLDQYPRDYELEVIVEYINFGLVIAFLVETLLKLIGLGFFGWATDKNNIFDGVVVLLSVVDISLSPPAFLVGHTVTTSSTKSLSGLRSLRTFALFKLARSWSSLQKLLSTMLSTLREVGNFGVLFLLFMYIYALIGMQTFANQFCFDGTGYPTNQTDPEAVIPRANFDTLLWSLVTVFQVLTGENWNEVLYDGWRSTGWSAVLYFVSLVVMGNFILLNLFLAILLGNFEESSDEDKTKERELVRKKSRVAPTSSRHSERSRHSHKSELSHNKSMLVSGKSRRDGASKMFGGEGREPSRMAGDGTTFGRKLPSRSLYVFTLNNPVRKFAISTINHPLFDGLSLFLIVVSTLALAIDNPLNPPQSLSTTVLGWLDSVLTVLFLAEVTIKIIAMGFVFGEGAYMRSNWNVMDFCITTLAAFSMGEGSTRFKFVKTLRTFRALRPLRMIHRNPGLKLVVSSLIAAIPQILNVMVVCLLVFTIFSILAVNNFKGKLYSCQGPIFDSLSAAQQLLITNPREWSDLTSTEQSWFNISTAQLYNNQTISSLTSNVLCQYLNATWSQTIPQSFDNVLLGVEAFFQITTTEGWVDMMIAGVDATDVDMQPIQNNHEEWAFFFVAFILIGNFFVMQLFIGVVIENFNRMKEKLDGTYLLTTTQREWLLINDMMLNLRPLRKFKIPSNRVRRLCYRIARNPNLDSAMMGCIILNTALMAMHYFGEEDLYQWAIDCSNYCFALIFTVEAFVKIMGLGRYYWRDSWNVFDFIIWVGSFLGMLYQWVGGSSVGTTATAVRSFRVGRLFRLVHSAPYLRQLFNTLLLTMPSLVNIGGLLFLVFFIYAAMGVQLFAKVKPGELVTDTANFQSISLALTTLVRCATGEGWNALMYELASTDDCVPDPPYDENMCGFKNSDSCEQLTGCGSSVAFVYFYSFTLLVTFILLNIFIAVILEGFADEKDRANGLLQPQHYENFISSWAVFDPDATGFMEWHYLPRILELLEPPMGFGKGSRPTLMEMNEFISFLDLPIFRGNKIFFNDLARRIGKFVVDELSEEPLQALPSSINMEQRWRRYLVHRKVRKSDLSHHRVNQFRAALVLHDAVKAVSFQQDLKAKVQRFANALRRHRDVMEKRQQRQLQQDLAKKSAGSSRNLKVDRVRSAGVSDATSAVASTSEVNRKQSKAGRINWASLFRLLVPTQQQNSLTRNFQKNPTLNADTIVAALEFLIIGLSVIQLELSFRSPRWRENRYCSQLENCNTLMPEDFDVANGLRVAIALLSLVRAWVRLCSLFKRKEAYTYHGKNLFCKIAAMKTYVLEVAFTVIIPYPWLESFTSRDNPHALVILSAAVGFRSVCWRHLMYFPYPIREKVKVVNFSGNLEFTYREFVMKKVLDDDPLKKILTVYSVVTLICSFLLRVLDTINGECVAPKSLINAVVVECEELVWKDSMWLVITTYLTIGYGDITPSTRGGKALLAISAFLMVCLNAMFYSIINKKSQFSTMEARVHAFLFRMALYRKKDISAVMAVQASFRFAKSYRRSLVWHQREGAKVFYRPLSARLPNEVKKKLVVAHFQASLKQIMKYNTDGDPLNSFTRHIEVITASLGIALIDMVALKRISQRKARELEERRLTMSRETKTIRDVGVANTASPAPRSSFVSSQSHDTERKHYASPFSSLSGAWQSQMLAKCEQTLSLLKKIEQDAHMINTVHA